jgi:hypothetical protein
MIKLRSVIRGSWELRNLSMLANLAIIGLDRYLQDRPSTELLQNGIAFCDGVSDVLTIREPSKEGKAQLQYQKDVALSEKTLLEYFEHHGFTPETAIAKIQKIKGVFQDIVTKPTISIDSSIIETIQDELFTLSRFFFCSDAENLHELKERRSLKAYG